MARAGVAAGADGVHIEVHHCPEKALSDGPQALLLSELPYFLEDVAMARETYVRRTELANRMNAALRVDPH